MPGMGMEIERKFLVISDDWKQQVITSTPIVQGYLVSGEDLTVRARVRGDRAYVTFKGRTEGISRSEFEYEIPVADARAMLEQFAKGPVIDKVRHLVEVDGHTWEVDVFGGENAGLVMAELELQDADEQFTLPDWAGLDVSDDDRYYNVNLATHPFSQWGLDG